MEDVSICKLRLLYVDKNNVVIDQSWVQIIVVKIVPLKMELRNLRNSILSIVVVNV